MAGELYRTYEVLVEESVVREQDKDPKTKKESRYKPEVAAALRDTNEIFQHAVCYYTLLLAGLVKDARDPNDPDGQRLLNPLWQNLLSGEMRQATDAAIRRLAHCYEPLAGVTDAEGFLERVFVRIEPSDSTARQTLESARVKTYRLLEKQGTKHDKEGLPKECETLNVFASSWGSILCDPNNETEIPGNGIYDILHRRLSKAGSNSDAVKQALDEAIRASEETHRGDFEREFVRDHAKLKSDKSKAKKLAMKEQLFTSFLEDRRDQTRTNLYKALKDGFYSKPRDLGVSKEEYDLREKELAALGDAVKSVTLGDPRLRRLRYGARDNSFEKPFFRLLWLRDDPQWAPLVFRDFHNYVEREEPLPEPELDGYHVEEAPFARLTKNLFPLFVPYMLGIPSRERSAWWNFDVSAFATAAEDVFKYKIRTQDRKRRSDRFGKARDAFEGVGVTKLDAKRSHTGKPVTVFGMGDDPRAAKMEELLGDLASKLQFVGKYGLRPGTIGGWADLRKTFRKLERKAEKSNWPDTRLVGELQDAVVKAQGDNPDGFGSAAFFEMLCEGEFHCLWSAKLPAAENRERHAADFVRYYVGYSEIVEEIQALEEVDGEHKRMAPIRFTWPGTKNRHNETSYRHFDFKHKLGAELVGVRLFRKLDLGEGKFPTYELREDDTLTLAARRLKRDRVMTAEGNVVEALWCPPLALANANDSDAGKRAPKIGKTKKGAKDAKAPEVSFSLMVSDRDEAGAEPPVYLKVAIPITRTELDHTLRLNRLKWGNSIAGEGLGDDFLGFHLRWPVDINVRQATKLRALGEKAASVELKSALEKASLARGDRKAARQVQAEIKHLAKQLSESDAEMCKDAEKFLSDAARPLWCGDADKKIEKFQIGEESRSEFHALSVDLNVRFAAAYARLRVFINNGDTAPNVLALSRRLAPEAAHATDIRAHAYAHATLRLPGEDADVWTKTGKDVFELKHENYGKKGRMPVDDPTRGIQESKEFSALADALVPLSSLPVRSVETLSIPEMGDVLIRRLQRRLSRIKSLFKLRWRLVGLMERNPDTHKYDRRRTDADQKRHRREVATLLGRLAFKQRQEDEKEHPDNKRLRDKLNSNEDAWKAIRERLDSRKGAADEEQRCAELDQAIEGWDWTGLGKEIQEQLDSLLKVGCGWKNLDDVLRKKLEYLPESERTAGCIELLALHLVEHCLPLRKRHWHWRNRCLKQGKENEASSHAPMIRGARGLSVVRLEQVTRLRQAYQSLAKQLKRFNDYPHEPGKAGVEPTPTERAEVVDDCCEPLLDKRNQLREERVNQIAHMILAEALGMELENPAKATWEGMSKKQAKSACDLHGRYRQKPGRNGQPLPRCDLIVLEDLSRYRTSQDRARSENSQLMNWCHRAVVEKLRDITKPFGITIATVGAAYSSRFHSLSGLPGVRANHVSRGFHQEMPYAAWAEETTRSGKQSARATWVSDLVRLFEENPDSRVDLLMPVDGGKEFLPIPRTEQDRSNHAGLMNADENAAINIGLRALAHPDCFDVFTRIQTKAQDEQTLRVRNRRGWFAELATEAEERSACCVAKPDAETESAATAEPDEPDDDMVESAGYPNLFVIQDGTIRLPGHELYRHERFEAAPYGPYWAQVRVLCEGRIRELNRRLLQKS